MSEQEENDAGLNEIAQQLLAKIDDLPETRREFAQSLADQQLSGKKGLSEKQVYWLKKLHHLSFAQPAQPEVMELDASLTPIIKMFDHVAERLKYPKITMTFENVTVAMNRTAGGHYPGTVCLTDGGPYGANQYYGRVTREGQWMPNLKMEEHAEFIEDLLNNMAEAPQQVAAEYGQKSGRCCFCSKKLKDERSTHVGYGRTCASNWGMPYPKMSEVKETAECH